MQENQEKNIETEAEKKLFLFRKQLLELLKRLYSSAVDESVLDDITETAINELWSKIKEQYKSILAKFKGSDEYKNNSRIRKEFDKNSNPPTGKTILAFLKKPEKKKAISKSDIPEKTAIAHCFITAPEMYDEEWLVDCLKKDLTRQPVLNLLLETENKNYYLLYYSNETLEIEYAIIEVDYSYPAEKNISPVVGTIFNSHFTEKGLRGTGTLIDTGLNFFFEFEYPLGDSTTKTLVTLFKGNKSNNEIKYLMGTYSTIERNGTPVCGIAVVEKHLSADKAKEVMRKKISPNFEVIKNFLYYKRMIVPLKTINKLPELDNYEGFDIVMKNYSGLYRITYISRGQGKLFRVYGIIKNSGEIIIKLPEDGKIIKGIFKSAENNILHAVLDYDFYKGYYKFQAVLKGGKMAKKGEFLKGVYAGIGFFTSEPGAGRVLLEFTEPYVPGTTKEIFEKLNSEAFSLDSAGEIIAGMRTEEKDFFWGNTDTFIETQSYLQQFGISAAHISEIDELKKRVAALETKNSKNLN